MATFPMYCLLTLIIVTCFASAHSQPFLNSHGLNSLPLAPSPMVMHLGPHIPHPAAAPMFQPFLLVDIPQHATAPAVVAPSYNSMLNMQRNTLAEQAHMEGKHRRRLLILQRQQEMHNMQKRNRIQQMRQRQNTVNRVPIQVQNVNRQLANSANFNGFMPRSVAQRLNANAVQNGRLQNNRLRSGTFSPNFGRTPGHNRPTNNNIIVVERRLQHVQPSSGDQNSKRISEIHNFQPFENVHGSLAAKSGQNSRASSSHQVGKNVQAAHSLHGVTAAETVERVQVPIKKEINEPPKDKRANKNRLRPQGSRPRKQKRMRGKTFDFRNTNKNRTKQENKNKSQQSKSNKRIGGQSNVKSKKKQSKTTTSESKDSAMALNRESPPSQEKKLTRSGSKIAPNKMMTETKSQSRTVKSPKAITNKAVAETKGKEDDQQDLAASDKTMKPNITRPPNFASVPQAIKPFSSRVFGHVDRSLDGASRNSHTSDDETTSDLTQTASLLPAAKNSHSDRSHRFNGASVMDLGQTQDFLPPQLSDLGAVDVVTLDSKEFAQLEEAIQTGQPISLSVLDRILGAVQTSKQTPVELHHTAGNLMLHATNTSTHHSGLPQTALIEPLGTGAPTGPGLGVTHHDMHGAVGKVGESVGSIAMENTNNIQGIFTVQSGKKFPDIPASVSSIPSSIGKMLDKHTQRSQHKQKT